jgi:2'-5' RNA ligase
MSVMRAFLAVDPGEAQRRRIAAVIQELKASVESAGRRVRVTWVRPEALHLTVKFFAELDEQVVDPLRSAVREALQGERPCRIPLTSIGAFPRAQAPRAIWIGPPPDWQQGDEGVRVIRLVRKIADACVRIGAAPEVQPWRPHLTLARIRSGERDVARALVTKGVFDRPIDSSTVGALGVTEIALMRSELLPAGPVHTRLWTAAFD